MKAIILIWIWLWAPALLGQAVIVSATLETNRLSPGSATVFKVFGQVAPELRSTSDQLFSWYIDLLILSKGVAAFDHTKLVRSMSDNDPLTSSGGTPDEANVRGIYDTFLNTTNAGIQEPIELLSIPVIALAPGAVTLAVQAGTTVPMLAEDFLVAPVGDGPLLSGGDYRSARVELQVLAPLTNLAARITQTALPENRGRLITIRYPVLAGNTYVVEHAATPGPSAAWQPLPNPPHNLGYADDTNSPPARFYRIKAIQ